VLIKTLAETAKLIRSKNAGPFWLTFDVMFDDEAVYRRVRDQGVLTVEVVSRLYAVPADQVLLFADDNALAIKASIPRPRSSGSALDTDIFGGQQYAPLLDLSVELEGAAG
jgi:Domain of unknown function (DUF4387)